MEDFRVCSETGSCHGVVTGISRGDLLALAQEMRIETVSAKIRVSQLKPVVVNRIHTLLVSGYMTPGDGANLADMLFGTNSYVSITAHATRYKEGMKIAPTYIRVRNSNPEDLLSITQGLKKYNTADMARYKMLWGKEPPPTLLSGPAQYRNRIDMSLSGLAPREAVVRDIVPLIMTPERTELGQKLYAQFVACEYINLVS